MVIGTPLTGVAKKVLLCGSSELGKDVPIAAPTLVEIESPERLNGWPRRGGVWGGIS